MRFLIAIPIFNEEKHVTKVLTETRKYADEILVINDGSTDKTARILSEEQGIHVITHGRNLGYGVAIRSAFGFAHSHNYDVIITMDCDGQHEPSRIPVLLEAITNDVDIVSGSRYLRDFKETTFVPEDRRKINFTITKEINEQFGMNLTDTFCGFKAYRASCLKSLELNEPGWGMPLQLWVQAAQLGLRIQEIGIPLVYLDPNRSFGGNLDNPEARLNYYRGIIKKEAERWVLPSPCVESGGKCPV